MTSVGSEDDEARDRDTLLEKGKSNSLKVNLKSEEVSNSSDSSGVASSGSISMTMQVFWLSMWFIQNIAVTFLNKKALSPMQLPAMLTMVHMICNAIMAYIYIYPMKKIQRKKLNSDQEKLLFYFSLIFVSNIITGNWSLGLVSISFNQVMRSLVPGTTVVLSWIVLRKQFSFARRLSLVPIAIGVYIACTGDKTFTTLGLVITVVAIVFASIKAVLSSKFLTGDLNLHPVDLILHQAPYSALWCLVTIVFNGELYQAMNNFDELVPQLQWFFITGVLSFILNITSFFSNKATSALTLTVCGNVKQVVVILLSIYVNHDIITAQKAFGILIVVMGGAVYSYIGFKEGQRK